MIFPRCLFLAKAGLYAGVLYLCLSSQLLVQRTIAQNNNGGLLSFLGNQGEQAPAAQTASPKITPLSVNKIDASGKAFVLGQAEQQNLTPVEFAQRVAEALQQNHLVSATEITSNYPDVAVEYLKEALSHEEVTSTTWFIAQIVDHLTMEQGAAGWCDILRTPRPAEIVNLAKQLAIFRELLRQGRANEVIQHSQSRLPANTPLFLQVEFQELIGQAYLIAGAHELAQSYLSSAINLLDSKHTYGRATLALTISDVLRKNNLNEQANEYWRFAVQLASRQYNFSRLFDPEFWQRAIFLKPYGVDWPISMSTAQRPSLHQSLLKNAAFSNGAASQEHFVVTLYLMIGESQLRRHKPQTALIAFKNAETMTNDEQGKSRSQLGQAKALEAMRQHGASNQVLVSLAKHPNPMTQATALATLATMKSKQGALEQGYRLLKKSREMLANPLDRPDICSDFGFICLLVGRTDEGFTHIASAESIFQQQGNIPERIKIAGNLQQYFDLVGKTENSNVAAQRLAELESGATQVPPLVNR